MYPEDVSTGSLNQYAVLLKTIKSYAAFKFDVIIFNIEIDNLNNQIQEELRECINKNYSANKLILNFTRPSTLDEWKKDLAEVVSAIESKSPVLVAFNHDHPFVDYTTDIFNALVEKVFPYSENNCGKVLYYSHAPETISRAMNDKSTAKIPWRNSAINIKTVRNHWVDSIWVMTPETLAYILSRAVCKTSTYMGRIDWPQVSYDNLVLETHFFPREFFKHFDGYGHITGLESVGKLGLNQIYPIEYPTVHLINDKSDDEIVAFYYARWVSAFLLSIRDQLVQKYLFFIYPRKSEFIEAIENTLSVFRQSYINMDIDLNQLKVQDSERIFFRLRSKIYSHGNDLYSALLTEIVLIRGSFLRHLLLSTFRSCPEALRIKIKWLYCNKVRAAYAINRYFRKK